MEKKKIRRLIFDWNNSEKEREIIKRCGPLNWYLTLVVSYRCRKHPLCKINNKWPLERTKPPSLEPNLKRRRVCTAIGPISQRPADSRRPLSCILLIEEQFNGGAARWHGKRQRRVIFRTCSVRLAESIEFSVHRPDKGRPVTRLEVVQITRKLLPWKLYDSRVYARGRD